MTSHSDRTQARAELPSWNTARTQLKTLEDDAERMSPRWLWGMSLLIGAAMMFIASALILSFCLVSISNHFDRVQQVNKVLALTANLQVNLDEAVSEARGFMVLKDESLLQVRAEVLKAVRQQMEDLKAEVRDDPEAALLVRAIEPNVWSRKQLMDEAIALSRLPDANVRLRPGEAKRRQIVRLLNSQMADLRSYERKILADRQEVIHLDMQFAIILVLLTGIAAPVCGILGIRLLHRERDIQRAHELQNELMHVQRLSIMGETSAMLAHEINQPLSAAANYLSVLRRNLDAGAVEKAKPIVERISEQIERTGTILKKLRRFIEKRETERTLESPEVLVEDAVTLLGTIDSEVSLETRIGSALPRVMVDRIQLQQVLVNLMRNAIEAMQDCPRRELTLAVFAPDHKSIEICLTDTGPGLADAVRERLFQPFVSTKQNGMGVGLSICRSIIEQHDGQIWAEPNPGGGTAFRFTLPAVRERAAA